MDRLGFVRIRNKASPSYWTKLEINVKYIIYSSDLKRTAQTAEIINKHLNFNIIYDQRLRERNIGMACGKSVAWLKKNIEKPEIRLMIACFLMLNQKEMLGIV